MPTRAGSWSSPAPARFGRGEQTLTDRTVRDTWEVPRELVRVEWAPPGLAADLDVVRDELGLPSNCRLTAELHSVLVYERGQFFTTHQDSEKDDAMVATLVVTLPSSAPGASSSCTTSASRSRTAASMTASRSWRSTRTAGTRCAGCGGAPGHPDVQPAPGRRQRAGRRAAQVVTGEAAQLLREHVTTPIARSYAGPAAPRAGSWCCSTTSTPSAG